MIRRALTAGLLAVAVLTVAFRPAPAADKDAGSGGGVYHRVLKSVVWIVIAEDAGGGRMRVASGSGSVISVPDRLVLTNYHVVRDAATAKVMFPIFKKGELVPEKEHYKNIVLNER